MLMLVGQMLVLSLVVAWVLRRDKKRRTGRRLYRVVWKGGTWAYISARDPDEAATFGAERYAAGEITKVLEVETR